MKITYVVLDCIAQSFIYLQHSLFSPMANNANPSCHVKESNPDWAYGTAAEVTNLSRFYLVGCAN